MCIEDYKYVCNKSSDARSVLEEKMLQGIFVIMKNLCLKLQMLWEIAKHRKVDFPTTDYVGNQHYYSILKVTTID